jgi:predicted nucleotide-binding protein
MLVQELQILSEALWGAIKSDLEFFSPIQVFVKRLAETDYSDLSQSTINSIKIYDTNINSFFDKYRATGTMPYIAPNAISNNRKTVTRIHDLINELQSLNEAALALEAANVKPEPKKTSKGTGAIFIGHGRSKLYAQLQLFLQDDYALEILTFESESRTSESIVNVLEEFLDKASFAILIMTAEDETGEGKMRARQNVIHEAGLFQGRLGFRKVIILKQNETEEFSNIAGLQYIGFAGSDIEQTFYPLLRALKKDGIIK